ncbi:MAG: hypothetical protein KDD40_00180 [Bdellovibrionales bacterium]|nr:hypothetical protein [Bdellovibrionales bacterium]
MKNREYKPKKGQVTDKELLQLAEKHPDFLIFIWSPELPLSLKTLPIVKELANKKKLPLYIYLFMGSSLKVASAISEIEKYPKEYLVKMNSFELSLRGINRHRPGLFRYKNGQLLKNGLFGYKSLEEYESIFNDWEKP